MTASRRRWFQFSLATLFVGVTLVCCWLGYTLNWIHERHRALAGKLVMRCDPFPASYEPPAPFTIRLFGERGCYAIYVSEKMQPEDVKRIERLFPESEFNVGLPPAPSHDDVPTIYVPGSEPIRNNNLINDLPSR